MDFKVTKGNIEKGLDEVNMAIPKRSTLPVLSHVSIEAVEEENILILSGTDMFTGVISRVDAIVDKSGKITIPSDLITGYMKSLPDDTIKVTLNKKGTKIKIACLQFNSVMNVLSEEDDILTLSTYESVEGSEISFDKKWFIDTLNLIVFAAASDDNRPVLTGVNFQVKDNTLLICGTDGYRVSYFETDLDESVSDMSFLIPKSSLSNVMKLITNSDLKVEDIDIKITTDDNNDTSKAFFRCDDRTTIMTNLLSGDYPNVAQFLSKDYKSKCVINVSALNRASKVTKLFSKDQSSIITFQFKADENKCYVTAASDVGENEVVLDVEIEGDDVEISFNADFVTQFTNGVKDKNIVFRTESHAHPGTFNLEGDNSLAHIIMPMHTQEPANQ